MRLSVEGGRSMYVTSVSTRLLARDGHFDLEARLACLKSGDILVKRFGSEIGSAGWYVVTAHAVDHLIISDFRKRSAMVSATSAPLLNPKAEA
jgi:hypothetical protein